MPPDLHRGNDRLRCGGCADRERKRLALQPFDTIRIFRRYESGRAAVTVSGEVLRPGAYPLSEGMTAAQLVRMAGGFKRDALLDDADLMSYRVTTGTQVVGERQDLRIGDAVKDVRECGCGAEGGRCADSPSDHGLERHWRSRSRSRAKWRTRAAMDSKQASI